MRRIYKGSNHKLFQVRLVTILRRELILSSTLKELIADICVESGLEESELDRGLTWKILAQRIGTTKLEADTILSYEKCLKDAEWHIMVSTTENHMRFI